MNLVYRLSALIAMLFILVLFALKLSSVGYPITAWFFFGVFSALALHFTVIPQAKRQNGTLVLSMLAIGIVTSALINLLDKYLL